MKRTSHRLLIIFTVAYVLQSCSAIRRLEVESATWNCIGSGQTYCYQKVVQTNIWKSKNDDKIEADCPNGISRVKITTKPGDVFLGALSLGFVVRQRVEWDCSQSSGTDDMR